MHYLKLQFILVAKLAEWFLAGKQLSAVFR
jgi:hypothetical protein